MDLMQTAVTIDMLRRRARIGWVMMGYMLLASPVGFVIACFRAGSGGSAWEAIGWGFMSGFASGVLPFLFLNSAVLERNDALIAALIKRSAEEPRDLSKVSNEELVAMAKEHAP